MGIPSAVQKFVTWAGSCREDEVHPLIYSFTGFGLVLASYFFLLPLRDEAGVSLGTAALPALFASSLVLTVAIAPAASALLQRHEDKGAGLQKLYRGMALSILFFFVAYQLAGSPEPGKAGTRGLPMTWQQRVVRAVFYLWVSLMNLVGVATCWARASDVFTAEASARLFGMLGAGQLVASLAAAGVARLPIVQVGEVSMAPMLLAVCCLEAAGHLATRVQLTPAAQGVDLARQRQLDQGSAGEGRTPWSNLAQGVRLISASVYLQRICLYVVFNYFVSSFFYFEKTVIVARVPDAGARTTWFAAINSASASAILVLQLTLTGRALRGLGLARALVLTPLCAAALMAGVSALARPATIAAAEVTRKVLTYSLARPAREVLFTVLSREEKYGAKVFMDTVVQRVGDASAAAVFALLVPALGLGPERLALTAIPLCLAWAGAAWALGRQHAEAAAAQLRMRKHSGEALAAQQGLGLVEEEEGEGGGSNDLESSTGRGRGGGTASPPDLLPLLR